jgi:hypothetical protein
MKTFVVIARFTNGLTKVFRSTKLENARAQYNAWMADIQSVYVSIR